MSVNVKKISRVTSSADACEEQLKEYELQIDSLHSDITYRDTIVQLLYTSAVHDSNTINELRFNNFVLDSINVKRDNEISTTKNVLDAEVKQKKTWRLLAAAEILVIILISLTQPKQQ